MDRITNQLWIGDIRDVSEEDTDRFDAVVSVCQDRREENVGCPYYQIRLADDEQSEERWGGSCEYDAFAEAVLLVELLLRDRNEVLLHCHHGKNRSVAVAAAVLAVGQPGIDSVNDALDLVMWKRSIADPDELMRNHAKKFVMQRKNGEI